MTFTTVTITPTSNVKIGKIAHGLMMMTWRSPVVPEEQCFETLKASLDSAGPGEKVFINSGEFYGVDPPQANLHLLNRFFTKYPEYIDKAFLSVKGASGIWKKEPNPIPDASPENLRLSVESIIKALGPKKLDLFECARVDRTVSIEDTITTLKGFVEEGLFDYIGVSECKADTLRRANAVHPIAAIEIEISPWSYEDETKKVIATAAELGVSVIGYSPLGRGFLTGNTEFGDTDFRKHYPRFQEEAKEQNMKLVAKLTEIGKRKNATSAQICIAWVSSLGPHVLPLPGSSAPKRVLENFAAGNIEFTPEEKKELDEYIANFEVIGTRYPEAIQALNWG